jgi:hypothetical protein
MEVLELKRSTFYSKVNKYQALFGNYFIIKNGQKYITEEGLEIIRNDNAVVETIEIQPPKAPSDETLVLQEAIKQMAEASIFQQKQVAFLQEQLREKDNQLKHLTTLVENGQVLLKNEQEQRVLLQEKYEQVTQYPEETISPPQTIETKGIWKKIFG